MDLLRFDAPEQFTYFAIRFKNRDTTILQKLTTISLRVDFLPQSKLV
jgi:hypothetical protein